MVYRVGASPRCMGQGPAASRIPRTLLAWCGPFLDPAVSLLVQTRHVCPILPHCPVAFVLERTWVGVVTAGGNRVRHYSSQRPARTRKPRTTSTVSGWPPTASGQLRAHFGSKIVFNGARASIHQSRDRVGEGSQNLTDLWHMPLHLLRSETFQGSLPKRLRPAASNGTLQADVLADL